MVRIEPWPHLCISHPSWWQAKPWLRHQIVVKSYFLVCLYTVSLLWPLLLRTPAVLGRQNCLAKVLLPLRSQASVFGRPKQDFCTIAPRNSPWGKPRCRPTLKTRAVGTWRILAALLGLLLFLPWAALQLLQISDSAHRFEGYQWVTGRSSTEVWSVHLVIHSLQVSKHDQLANGRWRSISHYFHKSHHHPGSKDFNLPAEASRRLSLVPRYHVPPCHKQNRVSGTMWAAVVGRREGGRVGEKVAIGRHPSNACLRIQCCQVSPYSPQLWALSTENKRSLKSASKSSTRQATCQD